MAHRLDIAALLTGLVAGRDAARASKTALGMMIITTAAAGRTRAS